jgi:hypothetical protein
VRPIKFRQKIHNGWHYWGFIEIEGHLIFDGIITGGFFTIQEALKNSQQFTGLLDKNGKEIWEEDIVKTINNEIGKVVFSIGAFWAEYVWPHNWDPMAPAELLNANMEVIGNIYENPEILEDPISREYRSDHSQEKWPGKNMGD